MEMIKRLLIFSIILLLYAAAARAYRPFGTEDAGVAGKGVVQLEASWDYLRWGDGKNEKNYLLIPILGVTDQLELSAEIPYLFHYNPDNTTASGTGDINLVIKHLLLPEEAAKPAFALKGVGKMDNGDYDRGLGSGDKDWSIYTVASKTMGRAIVHSHLGYTWVGKNKNTNLRDIPLFALGIDYGVTESFRLLSEISGNRHPDSSQTADPRSWLLGMTYKLSNSVILDAGIRWGLSPASPNWNFTAGLSATL